ncbi:MAG: hypothetical protein ACYS8Z_03770 [Planctomycetota bacterium]|jgi:hypothetical protein
MATNAQIEANRKNAKKSTGPKTPQGKAAVAQNAIKHGLTATRDVVITENKADFNAHRDALMQDLNPQTPTESILAQRIISLSWRLRRAVNIQDQAIDAIDDNIKNGESPWRRREEQNLDPALSLGRIVYHDFKEYRAFERLLMYEKRIENSLYKTMKELNTLQKPRSANQNNPKSRPLAPPPAAGVTSDQYNPNITEAIPSNPQAAPWGSFNIPKSHSPQAAPWGSQKNCQSDVEPNEIPNSLRQTSHHHQQPPMPPTGQNPSNAAKLRRSRNRSLPRSIGDEHRHTTLSIKKRSESPVPPPEHQASRIEHPASATDNSESDILHTTYEIRNMKNKPNFKSTNLLQNKILKALTTNTVIPHPKKQTQSNPIRPPQARPALPQRQAPPSHISAPICPAGIRRQTQFKPNTAPKRIEHQPSSIQDRGSSIRNRVSSIKNQPRHRTGTRLY